MKEFDSKIALVTGAAMGMGAAIASAFAREGATVAMLDLDERALEEQAAAVEQQGGRSIPLVADLRDASQVDAAFDRLATELGGVDVLVNNAGVARIAPLTELTEEDWDFVLDINLKAMFLTCRRAVPLMRGRGGGAIVNVASVQAYWSQAGSSAYSASKAGVVGFSRALALDLAREGIRVVAVAPGSVRTPMLFAAAQAADPANPDRALDMWAAAHPIGRLIEPEDVAEVVLFLASARAAAVTGPTLLVDGGIVAGAASW